MRRLELSLVLVMLAACASTGGTTPQPAKPAAVYQLSETGKRDLNLAQGYLGVGQLDKASEWANKALASDPKSADVRVLVGMIAARNGDTKKAGAEFDRALKLAPNNGAILNAHASWICELGQTEQAEQEFSLALQDPNYTRPFQALANAGKCALGSGQLIRAEGYFRRALVLSPEDRAVLYLMADTELRLGKIMEAQAFIQRRDDMESDAQTLALAARIEDAAGNALAAARYRKRLQLEFPNYVPTGEGAKQP